MKKEHLFWIIPICIILGVIIGLTYGLPDRFEIDTSENVLEGLRIMKNITEDACILELNNCHGRLMDCKEHKNETMRALDYLYESTRGD